MAEGDSSMENGVFCVIPGGLLTWIQPRTFFLQLHQFSITRKAIEKGGSEYDTVASGGREEG